MILNQTKLNWYAIDDSLKSITDSLFIEAIEMCTDCKLEFVMKKITTNHYRHTGPVKEDYDNSILKLYGYKAPSLFIAVSPQYFYGNNQWMGIEFSFPSSLRPPNVVKDSCRGKLETYYKTDMIATSMFGLGFKKNISVADTWGMNISYLSFTYKWINVRPINFSYMNNVVNKSWGYSPELGFQFWHFHLNAGYNLAFRKSMRDYEKLYFTAKFDIPLFREYI